MGAVWTLFCKSVSGLKVINVGMLIYVCIDDKFVVLSSREIRTSK